MHLNLCDIYHVLENRPFVSQLLHLYHMLLNIYYHMIHDDISLQDMRYFKILRQCQCQCVDVPGIPYLSVLRYNEAGIQYISFAPSAIPAETAKNYKAGTSAS